MTLFSPLSCRLHDLLCLKAQTITDLSHTLQKMAVTCLHHSLHCISWSQDSQLLLLSPGKRPSSSHLPAIRRHTLKKAIQQRAEAEIMWLLYITRPLVFFDFHCVIWMH